MSQHLRLGLCALVTVLLTAMVQEQPPTLPVLSRGATVVFVGTVQSQHSEWDATHKVIVTRTQFSVDEWLKGPPVGAFTITEMGGTVDGTTLTNPGQAHYRVGGRYLVFGVKRETGGVRTYWGPYGAASVDNGQVDLGALGPNGARPGQLLPLADVRAQLGVLP